MAECQKQTEAAKHPRDRKTCTHKEIHNASLASAALHHLNPGPVTANTLNWEKFLVSHSLCFYVYEIGIILFLFHFNEF